MRRDTRREHRILMEIIVDAYTPEEQAMGWYYYLDDKLKFPFRTDCTRVRAISPLRKGDKVEVIDMAPEVECQHEMFVRIRQEKRPFAVPLAQLKPLVIVDHETKEAVGDWHYWIRRGYEL